jgi:hypothetical protein
VAGVGAVDVGVIPRVGVGTVSGPGVSVLVGVGVGVWPGAAVLLAVGASVLESTGVGVGGGIDGGPVASVCDSAGARASVPIVTASGLTGGVSVMRRATKCSAVSATAPRIHPGTPRTSRAALDGGVRALDDSVPALEVGS